MVLAVALAGRVLTVAEMRAADRAAIEGGRPGWWLMDHAGRSVADAIRARFALGPTVVLCGPGNNGGDGFVCAVELHARGWPVRVALLGSPDRLHGDVAWAAARWKAPVLPFDLDALADAQLVVDALFGAGLTRDVEGETRTILETAVARGLPVVAVDVPSGVDGDDGTVHGFAPRAALTVTFGRPKPGHLLLPGRRLCGELVVAEIGLPAAALAPEGVPLHVNDPSLWRARLPRRLVGGHKYDHGHAVVLGGPATRTGASRLSAEAALRAGAGLVTVTSTSEALPIYAATLKAVMVAVCDGVRAFEAFIDDPRHNAVLLGPGAGVGETTRRCVLAALARGKASVLDADAITSFSDDPRTLFDAIRGPCVLTPHDGEFRRLFDPGGGKVERVRRAAADSGTVVLLKGSDTVIAAPDGRAVVQAWAPSSLATAGTGDVLAGIMLGLVAQGMAPFDAAAAATWIHARAAAAVGSGSIAEDLAPALPGVLGEFDLVEAG